MHRLASLRLGSPASLVIALLRLVSPHKAPERRPNGVPATFEQAPERRPRKDAGAARERLRRARACPVPWQDEAWIRRAPTHDGLRAAAAALRRLRRGGCTAAAAPRRLRRGGCSVTRGAVGWPRLAVGRPQTGSGVRGVRPGSSQEMGLESIDPTSAPDPPQIPPWSASDRRGHPPPEHRSIDPTPPPNEQRHVHRTQAAHTHDEADASVL